jgi:Fe-S cluster assembly protein SufD
MTEAAVREIASRHQEPEWLLERRLAALRVFDGMAMPNPLEEEWRRTDLSTVDFDGALAATRAGSVELKAPGLPARVVFVDLATAARDHEALIKQHLHSLVLPSEWKLAALQAAAWVNGAFVHVPAGVEVDVPLSYLLRQNGAPLLPHLLIVAEPNSSVTVIQDVSGEAPSGWSLLSGAVEIIAGADSRVRFVDINRLGSGASATFSTMRARLDRGAELSAALIGLGGTLSRTKLEVTLAGDGSRAEVLGLAFGDGKQHFDYVTLQDHIAPRTASDLLFKAALDGESSTVWTGTVRIQKGASAARLTRPAVTSCLASTPRPRRSLCWRLRRTTCSSAATARPRAPWTKTSASTWSRGESPRPRPRSCSSRRSFARSSIACPRASTGRRWTRPLLPRSEPHADDHVARSHDR